MSSRWPPTRYQQHLKLEQARRFRELRELEERLARLSTQEREAYDRKIQEEAAEALRFYRPKRQRTRTIVRFGGNPEERVRLWKPPTRKR